MSRKLYFLLAFSLVLFYNTVHAAPAVNTVSGTANHNASITISGSSFSTKSPANPLWWDDGEGAPVNNKSIMTSGEMTWVTSTLTGNNKHYNSVAPRSVSQGAGNANMQYRNIPYRNMPAPHTRSSTYAVGCHDDQGECLGGEVGQNVALNVSDMNTSDVWYISYYIRLDEQWPAVRSGHNYKYFNWEASSPYTIYRTNNYHNINACGGGHNELRRAPACNQSWTTANIIQITNSDCGDSSRYPVITHDQSVNNERRQWVRNEVLLKYSADFLQEFHDNTAMVDTDQDGSCNLSLNNGTAIGGVTLGGFWKEAMCGGTQDDLNDNACRYFDDVYVDKTFARVVLTNNANYNNASIIEPQIPLTWNNTSISARVNLGKLPNQGTAYLFVFDSSNNHNSNGYPITIGGGGGGDALPPNPPTGLRIEEE